MGLHTLYSAPHNSRMIKSSRMDGSYSTHGVVGNACNLVVGNPERKRQLRRAGFGSEFDGS